MTKSLTLLINLVALVASVCQISRPLMAGPEEYFPREDSNTELIYLHDPRVDFEVRSFLFYNAQSVELVTHSFNSDDLVGMKLIHGLRSVLNRGGKVTAIFEGIASALDASNAAQWFSGASGVVAKLLTDDQLKNQAEVFDTSTVEKLFSHVDLSDLIHEKITIIDRGLPSEMVIIGGRNYAKSALEFSDSAFILRPLDHTKSYAGTDVKNYFSNLKHFVSQYISPTEKTAIWYNELSPSFQALTRKLQPLLTDDVRKQELVRIVDVLTSRAGSEATSGWGIFHPKKTQLLVNNVLYRNAEKNEKTSIIPFISPPFNSSGLNRNRTLEFLVNQVGSAKSKIEVTTFVINFPSELQVALKSRLKDLTMPSLRLNIFTNDRSAHRTLFMDGEAIFFSFENALDLYSALPGVLTGSEASNKEHSSQIQAQFFDLTQSRTNPDPTWSKEFRFCHRKAVIFDDTLSVIGSDNLTESGNERSNDIMLAVWDEDFSKFLSQTIIGSEQKVYKQIGPKSMMKRLRDATANYPLLKPTIRMVY